MSLPILECERITMNFIRPFFHPKIFLLMRYFGFWQNSPLCALKEISFSIARGEKVALWGSNGSGKTSLLRVCANIYTPSSGNVVRRGDTCTLLVSRQQLHEELTPEEHVRFYSLILKSPTAMDHLDEILEHLPSGLRSIYVRHQSNGYFQRIALNTLKYTTSDLILLDEPTTFLDFTYKKLFFAWLSTAPKAVVFATHDLAMIKEVADRVIVLEGGKLKEVLTREKFLQAYGR